jgi:polyisoprenoid-binding protein YceI
MRLRVLTGFTLFCLALSAQERTLTLDPAKTEVHWTLGGSLHTVHGKFQFKQGTMRFDPANGKASGELIVDAKSGDSGSGARDGRMHKSILESAKFPDVVFTPDRIDGKIAIPGTSNVQVHGAFKIHGVAHDMTLPAKVEATNDTVIFSTTLAVPYVSWGMKNPSTFILRVDEKVEITINGAGKLSGN